MSKAIDFRAAVRDRMAAIGHDQAAVARLVAPLWGIAPESAVKRLSRWFLRQRDITGDDLALLLGALELRVCGPS